MASESEPASRLPNRSALRQSLVGAFADTIAEYDWGARGAILMIALCGAGAYHIGNS
jgi:hypothetical protein